MKVHATWIIDLPIKLLIGNTSKMTPLTNLTVKSSHNKIAHNHSYNNGKLHVKKALK